LKKISYVIKYKVKVMWWLMPCLWVTPWF